MSGRTTRYRRHFRLLASGAALAMVGSLTVAGTAQAAPETLPVYAVVQEGLTQDEGEALADEFQIANALESAGSFSYVDTEFNEVPLETIDKGEDEDGRPTVTQALDLEALERIQPLPPREARERADQLLKLAGLSEDMTAEGAASHSELNLSDEEGQSIGSHPLDTSVTYQLNLAGLPVSGQGAKLRVTFGPDGAVTQLSHSLRQVEQVAEVPVISEERARDACAALYPKEVAQETPTLGYHFPALTATRADGNGTVENIFPQYTCNPVAETGTQAHRLVPAAPETAPAGSVTVTRTGDEIEASIEISGGTEPYSYAWSSSTTVLSDKLQGRPEISYQREPREKAEVEQVTVEVTDTNGVSATASVTLAEDGTVTVDTNPGGGGFGALTVGRLDVGIEQTVDEWQCAQASANGFRSVMSSQGVPTQFDWRGHSAWEQDFKEPSKGGNDSSYVDDVDAAWYTGHGSPSGFTFKSSVDDHWIVPNDARWGNRDLEWMQLESCQVLRDTDGSHNYFDRWREAFQGLHILNGYHTNAYCVGGGTGKRFAQYLFPKNFLWWEVRPALRVQSAWASMAIDKQPNGVVYRSVGTYRMTDGANNIGDHFWGQGSVGPDISVNSGQAVGMWSITGTV